MRFPLSDKSVFLTKQQAGDCKQMAAVNLFHTSSDVSNDSRTYSAIIHAWQSCGIVAGIAGKNVHKYTDIINKMQDIFLKKSLTF